LQHSLIPFHFWRNRLGKKVVLNAHGTDILGKGKLYEVMRKWNQPIFKKADLVVVPSVFFIGKLTQLGVNPDRLEVYPSGGINPAIFFPAEEKVSPKFRLGYLGRIDSGKGVGTLIRAFAKLPLTNIFLEICGPGAQKEEMERLAQNLGVNPRVSFLGNMPQNKIRDFFLRCDALIFPSELEESLGLVGLEAMACGLPVIGSGSGGMSSYLISGQNGIVFESGNVTQLVEKISDFYRQDQNYRNQLARNAIVTASRYHSERVNSILRDKITRIFSA
jgi:L-malate glycosyltransferase